MPFSPRLTTYYSQHRFGTNGEVYITERHIGFKGGTADFKIKVIMLSLILFTAAFSHVLLLFMSSDVESGNYPMESPDSIVYVMILASLALLIVLSFKRERALSKGFVWPRDGVDITVSGQSLFILEKGGLTRIDFDDESNGIPRILGDNIVEFEISDLSGLDYHEKVDVLEQPYRTGKISKELYEELKKRLPYL